MIWVCSNGSLIWSCAHLFFIQKNGRTTQEYPTIQEHGKSCFWPKLYNQKLLPTLRSGRKSWMVLLHGWCLGSRWYYPKRLFRNVALMLTGWGLCQLCSGTLYFRWNLGNFLLGTNGISPAGGPPMFSWPFTKFHWFVQLMGRGLSNPWSIFLLATLVGFVTPRVWIPFVSKARAFQKKRRWWPSEKHRGFLHGVQGEL